MQMDKSSDTDETSSSNTDSSSKPCNSAQLVWQINGQYHLKCSDDEDSSDSPKGNSDEVKMDNSSDLPAVGGNTSDSDNMPSVQDLLAAADDSNYYEASTSEARQRSRRDWQLLKWQTRQVAKAFVDNTINCVLEDMGFLPHTVETEDVISDGNLEHEAVSMAILSHGLQRSSHDTCTTFSHVDSSNSQTTFKNNRSSFHFLDGLSSLTKVRSANEHLTSDNQMGASCSFSSLKQVFQNGDVVQDVSSNIVTSEDRIIRSTENTMTAEHSKPHCIDTLCLQSQSSSLSPSGIFTQPLTDCDVLSPSEGEAHDEQPNKSYACSFSHKLSSPQKETLLSPFHKRKAEDFAESSKRCCHEISSSVIKTEHNHRSFTTSSTDDESMSNVQLLCDKVPSFEHFDFMDAAVAVAIQKKGLSAMACTEYG